MFSACANTATTSLSEAALDWNRPIFIMKAYSSWTPGSAPIRCDDTRSGHDCPLISFNSNMFYFYRYIPKSKLIWVKEVSGQMKPYDQGHFVYKRDQSPSCPAPYNFASPYNAIMKFALTSFFSALLVGCAAAQRVANWVSS